jgi:sulfur-carrier protein
MVTVSFTDNLKRHVDCPSQQVQARTVAEALRQVFSSNERLAGYILDDQGRLRKHVAIFVDGQLARDRINLSDGLQPASRVDVMQALSGG